MPAGGESERLERFGSPLTLFKGQSRPPLGAEHLKGGFELRDRERYDCLTVATLHHDEAGDSVTEQVRRRRRPVAHLPHRGEPLQVQVDVPAASGQGDRDVPSLGRVADALALHPPTSFDRFVEVQQVGGGQRGRPYGGVRCAADLCLSRTASISRSRSARQ